MQDIEEFDIYEAFETADDHVKSMVKDLEELKEQTAETHPDDRVFRTIEDALERSQDMTIEDGTYAGMHALGVEIYK